MPPKIPPLHRQRSCPCIFFGGPFANPRVAAGRLGASGGWRLAAWPASQRLPAADSPDGRRRRGFALFCLATDGLTLLPMADPLWPRAELDRLDPRRINSAYGWRILNARMPSLSARNALRLERKTALARFDLLVSHCP
jgi:hypothetical protein